MILLVPSEVYAPMDKYLASEVNKDLAFLMGEAVVMRKWLYRSMVGVYPHLQTVCDLPSVPLVFFHFQNLFFQ